MVFARLGSARRMAWLAGALAISLSACVATGDMSSDFSAEDEAVYLERFTELRSGDVRSGRGLSAYDPVESVPGAATVSELPWSSISENTIELDALANAIAYAAERRSTALLIWHQGKLQDQAYMSGANSETQIISRSLAKPLGVLAVGRAIEKGYITSLDQPVSDFFLEWQGTPKQDILVRHLLDMRSGLLPQGLEADPQHVMNRAYLHPRHDEVIIQDYPLVNAPGTRYEYANANSELVAPLIERATGTRYGEWVSRELLEPLGAEGGEVWVNRVGGTAHAGCCIMLPAETWLKLAMLVLNDGIHDERKILPSGFVESMRTTTSENPHAGLGVYVAGTYKEYRGPLNPEIELGRTYHSEPYLAEDTILFDGNGNQVVYIIPSQDLIILRTGERPSKDKAWDNAYLPNLIMRGIKDDSALEKSNLQPMSN